MKTEVLKALLSCLSALTVLAAGWFVGGRLTYGWTVRQKRRELQLSNLQQFYLAYGEFFAVWKLWNRLDPRAAYMEDRKWELLKRAAAAEAIVESLLVKVSSETALTAHQICVLACFRRGFQQLRQAIRQDRTLEWSSSEHPSYSAFKRLGVQVSQILNTEWSVHGVDPSVAQSQFVEITANKWEETWTHPAAEHHINPVPRQA